ncbi:MAG: hypothetical protein ABJ275_06505 [Maricaulaceae bacterium]
MNTKTFHQMLHGSVITGVSYIFVLETKQTFYFSPSDSDGFAEFVNSNNQYTLFYGLCPATQVLAQGKRASRETVAALPAVAIDIDVQSNNGAHAENKLPSSKAVALEWLQSLSIPKPTFGVDTGNGFHFYWVLETPIELVDEVSRLKAENLTTQLNSFIIFEGRKRGWALDNIRDLPRLLRVVGSYNHKGSEPLPVKMIEVSNVRYTVEELIEKIPSIKPASQDEKASGIEFIKATPSDFEKKANFQMVYEGCAFVRWCSDNQAEVSEPKWYGLISVVKRCEDGERLVHEVSKNHPQYDPIKTTEKATHALKGATGPMLCTTIAEKIGFEGCQTCPLYFGQKLASPLVLGLLEEKGLPALLGRWAYDLSTDEYVEVV